MFCCNIYPQGAQPEGRPLARIAGGQVALPFSLPYQIVIYIRGKFYCAGVLVSPGRVATIASCCYASRGADRSGPYAEYKIQRI